MALLTKSKYMTGLQCPKYLWMMFHDLDKIPEHDLTTLYRFAQGNIIGQLAKKLYPKGIDITEDPKKFKENLKLTKEGLKKRKILFEAGILADNIYSRADILKPVNKDEWDIIEVKGSTRVKDEHIHDVSFQKYVYEKAGLKIRKCFLMHINNTFRKKGEIDPKKLLIEEDITKEVNQAIQGIQERISEMLEVVNSKQPPNIHIGNGCTIGVGCISEDCWSFLPESNVFELYYGGKKSYELLESEILSLKDIPDEFKLNEKQEIQRQCANTNKPYLNKKNLKKFLKKLKYPVYYLDFEAFQTGVPLYEGTKPYQQIPFQFSLFKDDKKKITHTEFLHDAKEDPRKPFLEALKKSLGDKGSIVVYNQGFERDRIKELAQAFPKEKKWAENIISRFVDLIEPFKAFDYYHPAQKGSCSLKAVLPALTGKGYKDLNIAGGTLAAVSYYESIFGDLSKKEVEQIRKDLLAYCKLDTEGMVWMVEELEKIVK